MAVKRHSFGFLLRLAVAGVFHLHIDALSDHLTRRIAPILAAGLRDVLAFRALKIIIGGARNIARHHKICLRFPLKQCHHSPSIRVGFALKAGNDELIKAAQILRGIHQSPGILLQQILPDYSELPLTVILRG